jgi:hypothetical protein
MPLQIRRGSTAQRLAITPLTGELVYDTTTGQLFVGDGTTLGGATTTGITTEDAQDTAASLFSTGSHSGITFAYNDAAGRIDATVTVAATGPFDGDLTGSVFSDASTLLVDGVSGRLVGPLDTSGLVGDLDTGAFNINSSSGVVFITPSTRTNFGSNTTLVDGNVYITRNSYSSATGTGFTFAQHHETADSVNFTFFRTRGTGSASTAVVNGDDIIDFAFAASNGTSTVATGAISGIVDGVPAAGQVPMKFQFLTNNGTAIAARAELSAAGIWKVNSIEALSGTLTVTGNLVGNVDGDVTGSVFTDNSTRVIDGTDGRITTPSVTISNTGYLQLSVYANDTARNSSIPFPSAGMVVFNTTLTKFQGYTGSAWVDFN